MKGDILVGMEFSFLSAAGSYMVAFNCQYPLN